MFKQLAIPSAWQQSGYAMETNKDLTHFLAVAKNVLFWFPILTPIVISTIANCYRFPLVPGMRRDALTE